MSLELYHATNYTHCRPDASFYSSPDELSLGLHLVTILSVPCSIYGVYCILYITPQQMSAAKWVLLNVHVWTVVIDVVVNVLSIPMMFFPSASGVMLGWGESVGLAPKLLLYSIQALVCVFATAAISLFENRQNAIHTRWKIKRTWVRVLNNVFNYLVATLTVLPPYLTTIDVEAMQMEILKKIPCPSEAFFNRNVFILTDNPTFATILMATQTVILVPQCSFFVLHTWYHLVYVNSSRVSAATRRMQLKFLIGSLAQVSIPCLVIMQPIVYIWFSVNFGYFNQQLNNLIILVFSFHGLSSTICMIAVHKSYRNHFVRMATFGRVSMEKPVSVKVSSVRVTSHQ